MDEVFGEKVRNLLHLGIKAKACIYRDYLKRAGKGDRLTPDEIRIMDKLSLELSAGSKEKGEIKMTEDEAKEKWCPMVKMSSDRFRKMRCIGNDCMMWRWIERDRRMPAEPESKVVSMRTERFYPGTGYCGIAGK